MYYLLPPRQRQWQRVDTHRTLCRSNSSHKIHKTIRWSGLRDNKDFVVHKCRKEKKMQ